MFSCTDPEKIQASCPARDTPPEVRTRPFFGWCSLMMVCRMVLCGEGRGGEGRGGEGRAMHDYHSADEHWHILSPFPTPLGL